MSTNSRAATAVLRHREIPAPERLTVLEMLGLIDPGGRHILPDPPPPTSIRHPADVQFGHRPTPSHCGTAGGYRRHQRLGEPTCSACKAAHAAKAAEQRRANAKPKRSPTPIKHGTAAGYRAHTRRGIPACGPCRDAERDYVAARRQAKRAES